MFTIFSQEILSGKLLLTVTSEEKSNFSDEFKIEPIIANHLRFNVKIL